ncbi:MAG: bifunctional oligoribonuclease/PAP phosphatase NrnA [Haloferacaceae archaeon]
MQGLGVEGVIRQAVSFAQANPEAALAALAALVSVAVAAYLIRRYRRPAGARFLSLLADQNEVAVLMHPNPDPDAMAAAIGVASLAEQVGTAVTLQFSGAVRHQENRAFRTVLDLEMQEVDHVSDVTAGSVVLVDHNEPRGFPGAEAVLPFAVVDHHPGDGTGEAFTDVRTAYGSTASIVTEYFMDIDAKPVPPDQHASEVPSEFTVPSRVATGLLYGILADTNRLTKGASGDDFDAAGFLYAGVDEEFLDRIANPQVGADVLEAKARAIAGRQVNGSFAVSDVGTLSNVDAIPQAADELMRLEGITAVVVCGECNGTIHLSGRSRDDRVHMGRALQTVVEEWPEASAGGHARMGGGQVPVARADGDDGRDEPDRGELVDRIFRTLAGES